MDTTTSSYEVDLEDERLEEVNDKWSGISDEVTNNYQNMIDGVDEQYKDLQDAMNKSVEAQKQNQQALTDFTIEKIEQQKEQAHKDYVKEQSGAYKDWQKQSDRYGVNAEQMAASGMTNTGFSESSQVSMYNQYQNRVATAREALSQAMLNYDNNIKEAMLQNNSILAEIEADAAIKAAELALEGFQYKNSLILEQTNKKLELENMRSQEWYKMLEQINTENALAEDVRQFESSQAHEKDMLDAETQAEKDLWDYKNSNPASEEEDEVDKEDTDDEIDKDDADDEIDKDEDKDGDGDDETDDDELTIDEDEGIGEATFSSGGATEEEIADILNAVRGEYPVNTEYYRGNKNPDAVIYGTFKNGYQPKGISGHGKLKDSGDTITFTTTTLSGEKKTVIQKIWKAEDGTKWYWDGRYNKYLELKDGSTDKPDNSSTSGKNVTDNMESIYALGLGKMLSAEALAKLVAEGKVVYTVINGQRNFMWSPEYSSRFNK